MFRNSTSSKRYQIRYKKRTVTLYCIYSYAIAKLSHEYRTPLHQWNEFQPFTRHFLLTRPRSATRDERTTTKESSVNGLHCTFKRPPSLWLSPFCMPCYPLAPFSTIIQRWQTSVPSCGACTLVHHALLIYDNSSSRATHTTNLGNVLLIFVFRKTNCRKTLRITTARKEVARIKKDILMI